MGGTLIAGCGGKSEAAGPRAQMYRGRGLALERLFGVIATALAQG
jgi:hypothetical protein